MLLTSWRITTAGIIISLGTLTLFWRQLPPLVPLWYSRPWGQDQLAPTWQLGILPLGGLISQLLIGLLVYYFKPESFLAKTALVVSIVAQVILTLGLLRIVLLIS